MTCLFGHLNYQLPETEEQGIGKVTLSSVSEWQRKGWLYKGTLHVFENEQGILVAKNIPCRIFSQTFYDPFYSYSIEGALKSPQNRSFLYLKSKTPWIPLKKQISLVPKRVFFKKKVYHFLKKHLKDPKVSAFIGSLVTGECYDDVARSVFAKLGLAHLFAVSGFHFALFAFAFHFFSRLIFPLKMEAVFLLVMVTAFFLFIGPSPSVERAWVSLFFSLIAICFEKERKILNTFGLALLATLITNPFFVKDLGFQLSFLATGGILLFTSSFDFWLRPLFPKLRSESVKRKTLPRQYLYLLSNFFRNSLSLNLAVHLPLTLVLLATFHSFPLHSLIYNLFFPFLTAIALILLLLSLPFTLIPYLGKGLFFLTNSYTKAILLITEFPLIPSKTLYVEHIPKGVITVALTGMFLMGVYLKHYWEEKKGSEPFDIRFY